MLYPINPSANRTARPGAHNTTTNGNDPGFRNGPRTSPGEPPSVTLYGSEIPHGADVSAAGDLCVHLDAPVKGESIVSGYSGPQKLDSLLS